MGTPMASVIDASNNVAFAINMGGAHSGGNPFASTFIVKANNATVALANIDAAPGAFAAIAYQQGNLFAGVQGMFIHPAGRILLVMGYSEPGNAHVFEITMTSLLDWPGHWTPKMPASDVLNAQRESVYRAPLMRPSGQ